MEHIAASLQVAVNCNDGICNSIATCSKLHLDIIAIPNENATKLIATCNGNAMVYVAFSFGITMDLY